jgi:aerobic-type carbon monoxide dehydrogenase small subunit (CoxS/CutS family)
MPHFDLDLNGERRPIDADGDTPLLWILRDSLGLTGTKYGCGAGLCGACTVLEDGAAVRSCQVTLAAASGHHYTTIEGLSADGSHPCQVAWVEAGVSQCGYCQPGMILEVAALLARNAHPSPAEIDRALADHVCRCGTYPRLRRAAALAAEMGGRR